MFLKIPTLPAVALAVLLIWAAVVARGETAVGVILSHEGGMGVRELSLLNANGEVSTYVWYKSDVPSQPDCKLVVSGIVRFTWRFDSAAEENRITAYSCISPAATVAPRLKLISRDVRVALAVVQTMAEAVDDNGAGVNGYHSCHDLRQRWSSFEWFDVFRVKVHNVYSRSLVASVTDSHVVLTGSLDDYLKDVPIIKIDRSRYCIDSVASKSSR